MTNTPPVIDQMVYVIDKVAKEDWDGGIKYDSKAFSKAAFTIIEPALRQAREALKASDCILPHDSQLVDMARAQITTAIATLNELLGEG